jgi:hypothetical protein
MEEHVRKIAKRCIVDGVWTKEEFDVTIGGKSYDIRDLCKQYGIELNSKPKSKIQVNIQSITDKDYADLEQPLDSGDTEGDGDGDSEVSE